MNYTASISDFFKSPKWGMNLLLGGVCLLIPFVGAIVLGGWHVTGFWARRDHDPAKFPDFDFNQFGKYLERGIWPFLAGLVVGLVMVPFFMIFAFIVAGLMAGVAGGNANAGPDAAVVIMGVLASFGLFALLIFAMTLLQTPITLGATITQDFARAFNLAFFKGFITLVWKETVVAAIFMFGASILLMFVGMLACYFGMFFTIPLTVFGWHHLQKQLYDLYLTRGGPALTLNPKLADEPPPLPVA
jgi:hypothetical protein